MRWRHFGPFSLDTLTHQLFYQRVKRVPLKPREIAVLEVLTCKPLYAFSRDEIEKAVWKQKAASPEPMDEGALAVHIYKIRKRLGDRATAPVYIQTLDKRETLDKSPNWKGGYRFIASVLESDSSEPASFLEQAPDSQRDITTPESEPAMDHEAIAPDTESGSIKVFEKPPREGVSKDASSTPNLEEREQNLTFIKPTIAIETAANDGSGAEPTISMFSDRPAPKQEQSNAEKISRDMGPDRPTKSEIATRLDSEIPIDSWLLAGPVSGAIVGIVYYFGYPPVGLLRVLWTSLFGLGAGSVYGVTTQVLAPALGRLSTSYRFIPHNAWVRTVLLCIVVGILVGSLCARFFWSMGGGPPIEGPLVVFGFLLASLWVAISTIFRDQERSLRVALLSLGVAIMHYALGFIIASQFQDQFDSALKALAAGGHPALAGCVIGSIIGALMGSQLSTTVLLAGSLKYPLLGKNRSAGENRDSGLAETQNRLHDPSHANWHHDVRSTIEMIAGRTSVSAQRKARLALRAVGMVLLTVPLLLFILSSKSFLTGLQQRTRAEVELKIGRDLQEKWDKLEVKYSAAQEYSELGKGFDDASHEINRLLKLDPHNGYARYFRGDFARFQARARQLPSRPKGCVPFPPSSVDDFLDYVQTEGQIARVDTGVRRENDCFKRPDGFCVERTAYVNHLLAYHHYTLAADHSNLKEKIAFLNLAINYANDALSSYPTQAIGFEQCKPTSTLRGEAHILLEQLQGNPSRRIESP